MERIKIEDLETKTPAFRLEEFFSGRLEGWGVTLSRFESFRNQFRIEAEGKCDQASNALTLREIYTFDDGHVDTLNWTILKKDDRTYEGRETRIEGTAHGEQAGNAFHWKYGREVPVEGGSSSMMSIARRGIPRRARSLSFSCPPSEMLGNLVLSD
ncbi:DUF3833 family protein [Rhizobium sp. SIMBA_035]